VDGPSQPWYGLLPVGLASLTGRWEWLPLEARGSFIYLADDLNLDSTAVQERTYLQALRFAVLVTVARNHRTAGRKLHPVACLRAEEMCCDRILTSPWQGNHRPAAAGSSLRRSIHSPIRHRPRTGCEQK
jgi:hypothetical protein